MSYTISSSTTSYGTCIKRTIDTNGNFPIINREYIPSEGSKFQKLGFEKITRVTSPAKYWNYYSVVRNGKRKNYSIDKLKELFKNLNIQKVKGHCAKEFIGGLKRAAR